MTASDLGHAQVQSHQEHDRPAYLTSKGGLPRLPASSSSRPTSRDQNTEPSGLYDSSRGNDDSHRQQPAVVSSPHAHQLHLNIESHQSFSADLGSFLDNPSSSAAPFPQQSPIASSSSALSALPTLSSVLLKNAPCNTDSQQTQYSTASTLPLHLSTTNSLSINNTTAHYVASSSSGNSASAANLGNIITEYSAGHTETDSQPDTPGENMLSSPANTTTATSTAPMATATTSRAFSTSSKGLPHSSVSPQIDESQQRHQISYFSPQPDNTTKTVPPQRSTPSDMSYVPHTTYTPSPPTMAYPSPPLHATVPASEHSDCELDTVPSMEIQAPTATHTETSATQPQAGHVPPPHLLTPAVSYAATIDSEGEAEGTSSPVRVSLSDRTPSPSRTSSSSSSSLTSLSESRKSYQLQDSTASGPRAVMVPLQIPANNDFLRPIPQKSEDWAALIDTPASPIHLHHNMMMAPPPQHQFRGTIYSQEGLTDSPAPEESTPSGASGDYMQHQYHQKQQFQQQYQQQQQQPPGQRPPQTHAQTDPMGMYRQQPHQQHYNNPYQYQQYHNSTPSVPLNSSGTMGSSDSANEADSRKSYRKSWSASETLNSTSGATGVGHNAYGYLTPPRFTDDTTGRSRPSSGMRQGSSIATSVSLLTDAAILAKYREMAIKTNDPSIQLSFAKYLLEIGEPSVSNSSSSLSSSSPTEANPTRPSSAASNNTPPSSAPPSPTTLQQDPELGKKQLTLEAIYWIDRLAKEGQPEAQFIRGSWYEEGLYNTKKNTDKALRWYQSASKGDHGPAHYKVAYYCEKKKDNNKAVMLYKKAAIHNDVPANHRLAMVYLYGEMGQSRNMKAGLQYLKRAASFATESAPMSPYVLGLILSREYQNNLVIPDDIAFPDDGEALEWFRKSAQLGYGPANYKLGYCYEYGSLGCLIDPYLSIQHYERAVIVGDGNGEAEMALSGWYLSGAENCFPADDQLAFRYASMAADKQLPKAQYAMGYYHEVGISVLADMEKAMEFYKLAAANGNSDAAKRLEEQAASHNKLGHKNSIRRIKQGRRSKDQSCSIM